MQLVVTTTPVERSLLRQRMEVDALCARCGVARLELFGSAADVEVFDDWGDADFLVEFDPTLPPRGAFERYMRLLDGLEALVQRHVDLIERSAVTNPYFHIGPKRRTVYVSEVGQAA